MKDVIDIFIINPDGLLIINKIGARTIPEFKRILERDKGGKIVGDYDGRRKFIATREFIYIHLVMHPASIYRDLPDDARKAKAFEMSDLPEDWKEDDDVRDAMKAYIDHINMSSVHHTYVNASRALYALGEDLKFVNSLRERTRNKVMEKIEELESAIIEEDIQRLNAEIDNGTTRLMELGNKITNINDTLPKAYETLEKLKVKLINETSQGGRIYGGGDLGNREK